jgi:exopolysaccharide biosynthesis polyprenyl glycosylphosphotransferase
MYDRAVAAEPQTDEPAPSPPPVEDVRAIRPYVLSRAQLRTWTRRLASIAALATIDVIGLVVGLYAALALRSLVFDPKPILWGLLWDHETSWLAFLILLLILVFWQAGLYRPRETREAAARVVSSVLLVALLSLVFAIGTGQHFTTFGLYLVASLFVATLIGALRGSYETVTGMLLRRSGVRRKALLVGDRAQRAHLRETLGASRRGIYYAFDGECELVGEVEAMLVTRPFDEVIVADAGIDEVRLLHLVEAAHKRGVRVRVAPRTTELLIERGEYVPGQGIPLFELRPPIFAGAQWATKRAFDLVVGLLILIIGLPVWLLLALAIKLSSAGPVFFGDRRIGLGERPFEMLKFRTMVAGAADAQPALEGANEATGPLFKIRDDPRVTGIGKMLRRLSIDEVPNLINVLRGQMSLVGPRPLPVRDYERLEEWHRRRYNVLPGMTGLWQVAGRSDLTFDDLVRLDFYYIENWSIWLDISILLRTPAAVFARKGAY